MTLTAPPPVATGTPARPRRLVWRRRLDRVGLLLVLAALLLCAKVATMLGYNHLGRERLADQDLAEAQRAFASSALVNVLEPWVAPYDEGTVAYLRGDYPGARALLERALVDAPAGEECRVRTNLSLTHEALGDAARADGDLEAARAGWAAGREVLADGGCAPRASASEDESGVEQDARRVDRRLRAKLADTEQQAEVERRPEPPPRKDRESLEERNDRAEDKRDEEEERQEQKDREPREPDGTGQPPPTYSW